MRELINSIDDIFLQEKEHTEYKIIKFNEDYIDLIENAYNNSLIQKM